MTSRAASILLPIAVSAAVSAAVAVVLWPEGTSGSPAAPARAEGPATAHGDADTAALEAAVARLEQEVAELRDELVRSTAVRRAAAVAPDVLGAGGAPDLAATLRNLDPSGREALFEEVQRAVVELDEAKDAAARAEELVERQEEAAESYAEYDALAEKLDEAVGNVSDQLGLSSARERELASLVAVQNERNREMTRLWAAGETSDEDLEALYFAHRAEHRAEVRALLGDDALPAYREFLQKGGLGGRFSYFTSPWEDWGADAALR
ncbi:MAG: hypothetical protein AAFU73_10890 [Planctomycetota bacterium]